MMKTYEFTIVATGLDPEAEDFEARFYDAGCDDALVSFQKGHILLDFCREASSFREAIVSALKAVQSTTATVQRIEPDPLVSLSDMAERAHMSRAAMTNYFRGLRGSDFPAPVVRVTTSSPLWRWDEVAGWLSKKGYVSEEVTTQAEVINEINETLLECH